MVNLPFVVPEVALKGAPLHQKFGPRTRAERQARDLEAVEAWLHAHEEPELSVACSLRFSAEVLLEWIY